MKRRLIFLLCASLAIGACGCGKEDVSSTISDLKDSVDEEISEVTHGSKTGQYDMSYYVSGSKDIVYTIDENGNKVGEYRVKDYKDQLDALGIDYRNINVKGCYDDVLYFNYYYDDGDNAVSFFAIDTATGEVAKFYGYDSDWTEISFDYYNGKVYIDVRKYETGEQKEVVFVKENGALVFNEEEAEINDILEKSNGKLFQSYDFNYSLQRTYDELGFLIAGENLKDDSSKWNYYKVTKEGETPIESLQNVALYLAFYGPDWAFCDNYENSDVMTECYSLEGSEKHIIKREGVFSNRLATDGNKVYYSNYTSKQYGMKDYQVYCYDCDTDTTEKLYDISSVPGTGNLEFGIDGFKVINGQIYALQFYDNSAGWGRFDSDKGVFVDINLPLHEYSVFNYGLVNYQSFEQQCPFCGITIYQTYTENFVLDAKYSEHAAEINKQLEPMPSEGKTIEDDSECEYHKEEPEQYCETDDTKVDDVNIIGDKFLTVNMSDYWFGGGAHGMPGMWQRIFDLTTGEELSVTDFYSGTEDEFKALVAQKTKEDYEINSELYFAETSDEVYDQAYESVSLVGGDIFWYEDHATYVFPPYELGSYAAGFIEIEIPYEDLFGASTLSRL